MPADTQIAPISRKMLWAGRIVSALPVLFLLMDGVMKLFRPPIVVETTVQLGYPATVILPLGIVLLACTVLYVIPRTAVLGAILLTGYLGGAVEMLTPTEGVDFTNYIARVLASVKRNWYAVMPESARLGDRGKVILQFRIMRNGVVPDAEPAMVGTSSKEPLDRAAVSSIRASTPFEPLPPAFSGPYIELRFIFLYNIPINDQ